MEEVAVVPRLEDLRKRLGAVVFFVRFCTIGGRVRGSASQTADGTERVNGTLQSLTGVLDRSIQVQRDLNQAIRPFREAIELSPLVDFDVPGL